MPLDDLELLIYSGQYLRAAQAIKDEIAHLNSRDEKMAYQFYAQWLKNQLDTIIDPTKINSLLNFILQIKWLEMEFISFIASLQQHQQVAWTSSYISSNNKINGVIISRIYKALNVELWPMIIHQLSDNPNTFQFLKQLATHSLLKRSNLSLFNQIESQLNESCPRNDFFSINEIREKINELNDLPIVYQTYLAQNKINYTIPGLIDDLRIHNDINLLVIFLTYSKKDTNTDLKTIYYLLDNYGLSSHFIHLVDKLDIKMNVEQLDDLCIFALNDFNIDIYNQLMTLRNHKFPNVPTTELPESLQDRLNNFNHTPEEDKQKIYHIMRQLNRGPGKINVNDSTDGIPSAALFILAAIKKDKQDIYDYRPTVFNAKDFKQYLEILNQSPVPVNEKFLIASLHWISGEIEILSDTVNIFLLDSFGTPDEEHLMTINKVFKDKEINFFVSNSKRQNSGSGCSVFALDDIRHLSTRFQYTNIPIFEHLNMNITERIQLESDPTIWVNRCNLPASIMRTKQSSNATQESLPYANEPVNRNKEPYISSVKKYFVFDETKNKEVNHRIIEKLKKNAKRVEKFIFENGYAKAAILAQAHTLGGFIEKSKSADSIDHKKEDLLSATFKKCFNENKENASPETDNLQSNPIWVKSK